MLHFGKQEYFERFEMCCWRGMKKIGWNDLVRDEEVLYIIKAWRDILRKIYQRKFDWIHHLLYKNCSLTHVIEEEVEGEEEVEDVCSC